MSDNTIYTPMYIKVNGEQHEMDVPRAIGVAEGYEEPESADEVLAAWQFLELTGMAYQLQGWFGRRAQELIAQGYIFERGEYDAEVGINVEFDDE